MNQKPFGVVLEHHGFVVEVRLEETDGLMSFSAEIVEVPKGEEMTVFLMPKGGGWYIGGVAADGRWYWGEPVPEAERDYQ